MDPHPRACIRCGKWITPGGEVYLELNCMTGQFSLAGAPLITPEAHSQGCFPFGPDCARKPNAPKTKAQELLAEERNGYT